LPTMLSFIQNIGRTALTFLSALGRLALFSVIAVRWIFAPPYYWKQLLRQIVDIGYYSLPVVGLTTLFSGMVLALQSYTGFARFSAEDTVATVVVLSVTRELGPVLAGLMVAGRIGASMAAELGTMRVTDQIDALDTLSTRPMQYLVAPRLLAGTICLPFLVLIGDVIGVFGGYIVGVFRLGFNPATYLSRTLEYLEISDVTLGLIKAAVFGFLIALMGCYHGYHSGRGAEGVGRATTNAVVSASILILISNYLVTALFFGV
jgi:phospholipid/cholesterol/gamma-HCH transport system permease protein